MLNRSSSSHSTYFHLLCMLIFFHMMFQTFGQTMQVQISNSPQFYYSHNCELTFAIISRNFSTFNLQGTTQTFMITILDATQGTRFLNYFVPPYVFTNRSLLIQQANIDTCNRGTTTSTFYCVSILSTNIAYPQTRLQYNSTHHMYKFTITNVVCPATSFGTGYHLKVKIDVPVSQNSNIIKMTGNYTHRFIGLKYRVIDNIYVNPNYIGKQVYQANNFLIGQSKISFVMDIHNVSQANNWQQLQIVFLQSLSSLTLTTSSCKLTSNTLSPFTFPATTLPNGIASVKQVSCSLSSVNNSLIFTNPSYINSSYLYNQAFNVYDMYDFRFPGVRLNFSIDANFSSVTTIRYYYQLLSSTSYQIDDAGKKIAISPTNVIIYENSQTPNTLNALTRQNYESIDAKYRAFSSSYNSQQNNTNDTNSTSFTQIIISAFTFTSLPMLIVVSIFILALLLSCCRKQLFQCQKYIFLIFVLTDLIVKIVFVIVTKNINTNDAAQYDNSNSLEISYLISVFIVIQYCGFAIISFFTYCTYIYYTYIHSTKHTKQKQLSQSKSTSNKNQQTHSYSFIHKNILLILFSVLLNYKLYIICLFNVKGTKSLKPQRYRNQQLYIKYCWHLCIEITIILAQIFCVSQSSISLPITIIFVVHQSIFILVMAVVAKCVYCMLKLKKKKKNKSNQISQHNKKSKIQQKNKQVLQKPQQISQKIKYQNQYQQQQIIQQNINQPCFIQQPKYSQVYHPTQRNFINRNTIKQQQ